MYDEMPFIPAPSNPAARIPNAAGVVKSNFPSSLSLIIASFRFKSGYNALAFSMLKSLIIGATIWGVKLKPLVNTAGTIVSTTLPKALKAPPIISETSPCLIPSVIDPVL